MSPPRVSEQEEASAPSVLQGLPPSPSGLLARVQSRVPLPLSPSGLGSHHVLRPLFLMTVMRGWISPPGLIGRSAVLSLQLDTTDRLSIKLLLAPTCLVNAPIPGEWVSIPEAQTARVLRSRCLDPSAPLRRLLSGLPAPLARAEMLSAWPHPRAVCALHTAPTPGKEKAQV